MTTLPEQYCNNIPAGNTVFSLPKKTVLTQLYQDSFRSLYESLVQNSTILGLWDSRSIDDHKVTYEIEPFQAGLQQYRGQNAPLPSLRLVNEVRVCTINAGYWGEQIPFTEDDWQAYRYPMSDNCGLFSHKVDLSTLTARATRLLAQRQVDRIRHIKYNTIVHGGYTVPMANGGNTYTVNFNVQSVTVAIPWTDTANATPFINIRDTMINNQLNRVIPFNERTKIVMNPRTANLLLTNTNLNDKLTVLGQWCCTRPNVGEYNTALSAAGLPQIEIDTNRFFVTNDRCTPTMLNGEGGYINGGTAQYYVPDGVVVWVADTSGLPDTVATLFYTLGSTFNSLDLTNAVEVGTDANLTGWSKSISVFNHWQGVGIIRYPAALLHMRVF